MGPSAIQANVAAEYDARAATGAAVAEADRAARAVCPSMALAVDGLRAAAPVLSAGTPHARWQLAVALSAAVLFPAALAVVAAGGAGWAALLLTLPFVPVVLIRCAALWHLLAVGRKPRRQPAFLADSDLPFYSVLVPLHREREIAPALVHALRVLDYPAGKLEIVFITELHDEGTRRALRAAAPPEHMQILTVPAGQPQTKPRALNYALQMCKGDLVAVFDAEDVPHPRQLRLAAETFAASADELVCVQARLGVYNTGDGFLTRQFALEYASLFAAILPALERLGLPILLGGTSNHFRRDALEALGAWDPFNVTEDADLGIRIARAGKRVAMIDSETAEEAPRDMRAWYGQRTRWLKGWMQTYLVHMREPSVFLGNLGPWRFAGVQAMLGGLILSAFVHPLFYVAGVVQLCSGQPLMNAATGLWVLCWINLAVGYGVGIALGLIAAWRSDGRVPLFTALLVPFYWLAISAASYRALVELVLRPYHWEKTPHAARPFAVKP